MSYTVAEEFIVLRDGAAVHYSDIGSTVELSDAEAGELAAAGKVVPHAIVTVNGVEVPPAGIGTRPHDSEPGQVELADGTLHEGTVPVPDGDAEDKPKGDAEDKPKPARGR